MLPQNVCQTQGVMRINENSYSDRALHIEVSGGGTAIVITSPITIHVYRTARRTDSATATPSSPIDFVQQTILHSHILTPHREGGAGYVGSRSPTDTTATASAQEAVPLPSCNLNVNRHTSSVTSARSQAIPTASGDSERLLAGNPLGPPHPGQTRRIEEVARRGRPSSTGDIAPHLRPGVPARQTQEVPPTQQRTRRRRVWVQIQAIVVVVVVVVWAVVSWKHIPLDYLQEVVCARVTPPPFPLDSRTKLEHANGGRGR
ncbi:hypothetical protein NMY22_g11670 [Coprinellus aureogranulatus]|nr:hypothetical protein NMY22_g11670 [Coprinellus aureogranulatus]